MSEVLREQLQYLPDYLGRHLMLTLAALCTGIAVSLPLGIAASRAPRFRGPVLAVASVVQTIPALALLAFMVPLLRQIGFLPAYLALVFYSILPILRNTVTGLDDVEPRVIEAARGIGMTPTQILLKVRLPLAMPVIIAGIRTATVWTVGIATLATPVGATSLGNYIFSGLQTQNYTAVTLGSVVAAALALLLDGLVRLMEVASQKRSRMLGISAATALVLVVGAGVAPVGNDLWKDFQRARAGDNANHVVVGCKGFTEQYIVSGLMASLLEDAGFEAEVRENLGSAVVFNALKQNNLQCYLEYTGTVWANFMKKDTNPGSETVFEQSKVWLESEHDINVVGHAGFENLYALAMRREQAERLGIDSIDDLKPYAPDMAIASDLEFFGRPEWQKLKETYGLEFKATRGFDAALMYSAVREGQVDVITAYSTDGRIAAYDLVILDDPRSAMLPYDAMILASPEAGENDEFVSALDPLRRAITSEQMREANKIVDVDGRPVHEAVAYLKDIITSR